MRKVKDETGNTHGRLKVIRRAGYKQRKHGTHAQWLCQCSCGKFKFATGIDLRFGKVKSCGCLKRLPSGQAAFNGLYREYQFTANRNKREFEITKDLFRSLTSKPCFYCGVKPYRERLIKKRRYFGTYLFNGLDRIDSSKGYSENNVVPCCLICNRAKHTMSQDDFFAWVQRIHKHWRR